MLIDSHAHLQDREFNKDLDKVLARATEGSRKIVCIDLIICLPGKGWIWPGDKSIFATVGIHPMMPKL